MKEIIGFYNKILKTTIFLYICKNTGKKTILKFIEQFKNFLWVR